MDLFAAALLTGAMLCAPPSGPVSPRCVAPRDFQELRQRVEELHARYAPYLRSLPPRTRVRPRTPLGGPWRFTFELKDPPRTTKGIPPAPPWHLVGLDDSQWQTTTVPEWRYRTRGHDNAYDTTTVDKWLGYTGDRTTSQICWYRRTFTARKPPDGKRLWLCFDGVDWEAQVFLNGELLGTHRVYYEPFRFEVTDRIRDGRNTLAVRVIDGREFGEPMTYWATFPDIRAASQRYTPDRAASIQGNLPLGYHAGTGFGIWRDVYLETTGPVRVDAVLARGDPSAAAARVKVRVDAATASTETLQVDVLPENFQGPPAQATRRVRLQPGASTHEILVSVAGARLWSPDTPYLYRCRVRVAGDTMDVLLGFRSFSIVHRPCKPPEYTFRPVKARWLRIAGRGSDASRWNSIWEVAGKALVRDPDNVRASGQHPDYTARLALDGKADTRWAVEGDAWIQLPLDPTVAMQALTIGWYEASSRRWDFDLLVSNDGRKWTKLDYRRRAGDGGRLPSGMLLLNGRPCYLRGTNVQGFNAYAYWGQRDELIDAVLLLKAGNFNAIRSCQHVQMPEVREMLDRLGILSQQDQGGGYHGSLPTGIRGPQHVHAAATLARVTYNNPGVVLLCFGNEHEFPTADLVRAGLAVDPQRIFKPISGRFTHSRKAWDLPEELRSHAIDDGHPYAGWYGGIKPQTWAYPSPLSGNVGGCGRMVTLGEFGAEAMDAYETMQTYPRRFAPPPPRTDTLWACSQVQKHDVRQLIGLGRRPGNLAEFIQASQNYQEALLADRMIQMRLLPRGVAGYFHFHFMDVVPVFWPKSIVSHDHRPKKAYYQIAQINQPIVVLPRLAGQRPDSMTLWACNDLDSPVPGATVSWSVRQAGELLAEGRRKLDVAPLGAVEVATVDLEPVARRHGCCDLELTLADRTGRILSRYGRNLRFTPRKLLER